MPLLQDLDLSKNYQVSGSLPETWGNVTGPGAGLQSLKHFAVRSCNLTGTLPVSWANGLSGLSTLDLAYNYITGTCYTQAFKAQGMDMCSTMSFETCSETLTQSVSCC